MGVASHICKDSQVWKIEQELSWSIMSVMSREGLELKMERVKNDLESWGRIRATYRFYSSNAFIIKETTIEWQNLNISSQRDWLGNMLRS